MHPRVRLSPRIFAPLLATALAVLLILAGFTIDRPGNVEAADTVTTGPATAPVRAGCAGHPGGPTLSSGRNPGNSGSPGASSCRGPRGPVPGSCCRPGNPSACRCPGSP